MDEPPPGPGEIRFQFSDDGQRPSGQLSPEYRRSKLARFRMSMLFALGGCMLLAAITGLLGIRNDSEQDSKAKNIGELSGSYASNDDPRREIDSKSALASVRVPPAPVPPGHYAILAARKPDAANPSLVKAAWVGFGYERLEIVQLKPGERIPVQDEAAAIRVLPALQGHNVDASKAPVTMSGVLRGYLEIAKREYVDVGPRSLYREMTVVKLPDGGLGTGRPRTPVHSLNPYLFDGDVDIVSGSLVGDDRGLVALFTEDNSMTRAKLYFTGGGPRGPPVPVRKVYVRGKIRSYTGPAQFDKSKLSVAVLDLGPKKDETFARYSASWMAWEREVSRMALDLGVSPGDVRSLAGESVVARDGHLVPSADVHGKKIDLEKPPGKYEAILIELKTKVKETLKTVGEEFREEPFK
jgi:hypothetical protein